MSAPPSLIPSFGPLAGLRVLDTGRYVAGPWAATHLAEFGAEVIHVEGPPFRRPYSDPTRSLPPLLPTGAPRERAVSESWVQYSRNKLSLGLDLRSDAGRGVFLDLVRGSDLWIESSRPGTFDRLGLGDEAVRAANPRLTVVHVSGYGRTGEERRTRAPSFDLTAQAYSGFLSLQGNPPPEPPMRSGTALNDTVTGLAAAGAALMGVYAAQRTGRGLVIDVAQYEVFFTLLENLALDYFMRGVERGRHGNAHARLHPYDLFRARDGWVVFAAPSPESWARVKRMVGLTGSEWDDMAWRTEHRTEVNARLEEFCGARTVSELERLAEEHDTAISRVYSIADIARDPHYRAREMFVEWDDPVAGRVRGAGISPKIPERPGRVWRGAPWLGQDNHRILGELLGYSSERIEELSASGTVGEDPPVDAPDATTPFYVRERL